MELEHSHEPEDIAERLSAPVGVNYVRDWVYGGIDGAVTTFATVAGVAGAGLQPEVIIILGGAKLLADALSMAAANYSGTKTETDDYARIRRIEERHVDLHPEGEREELRHIYRAKGFSEAQVERMVALVTSRRELWIDTMLGEEYGLSTTLRSPAKAAASTFAAFVICGIVPLIPFLMGLGATHLTATVMTGAVFFTIGSLKGRWSTQRWWVSGLETLGIGLAAAGLAYLIGDVLARLVAG